MLKQMGIPNIDETKAYATNGRAVTFWPFEKDTSKIIGEDIYSLTSNFSDAEEIQLNPYIHGAEE
jgi:hypothetical protein